MATLWCLGKDLPADPWGIVGDPEHPPARCHVIEITPLVRAKDEADRAERDRQRRSVASWRRPESMPQPEAQAPINYKFPAGRANGKRRSAKRKA